MIQKLISQHSKSPRETSQKLEMFVSELAKWSVKMNLVSSSTMDMVYDRHVLDSLQLMMHLSFEERVVDVGTGAGFPGIVLSIMGMPRVRLVECNNKKIVFLTEVIRKLDLDTLIMNDRVENLCFNIDVVVSRGFADLKKLLSLTRQIRCKRYLLHKGARVFDEVKDASQEWFFDYKAIDSIVTDDSYILEILNARKLRD